MFQKFFESTIECKFIKSLLYNTNLPIINTVAAHDLMIKGIYYVYKSDIIKCTKTGYLEEVVLRCSDDVVKKDDGSLEPRVPCAETTIVGSRSKFMNSAQYDIIQPYDFGRYYPQLTQRYIPKNAYYDNETHRFLGDYLRCYRDLYDIDLMPFYNCYNYETFDDFHLVDLDKGWVDYKNNSVKVLAIPIKYNKTYTIAVESNSKVLCKTVLHGPFGMLKETNNNGLEYLTDQIHSDALTLKYKLVGDNPDDKNYRTEVLKDPKVFSISNTSFRKPFTIRVDNNKYKYQKLEKYLYLALQLPKDNESSVVVLEGDYSNEAKKIIDVSSLLDMPVDEVNKIFISPLGLLQINTNSIYAFNNRLIEYLLLNVITNRETVRGNIGLAQDKIDFMDKAPDALFDAWDNRLRYTLYNKYMNAKGVNKLDITGFVDKDMARFLNKTQKGNRLL